MKATPTSDGFATFLGGFSQSSSGAGYPTNSDSVGLTIPGNLQAVPRQALRTILHQLAATGPQTIATSMPLARLPFSTFAKAVDALCAADLVQISGEPGQERLELTLTGQHVAFLEL